MKKLSLALLVLTLVAALALPAMAHRKHRGGGDGYNCSGPCGESQPRYEQDCDCNFQRRDHRRDDFRNCDNGSGDYNKGRGQHGRKFMNDNPEATEEIKAAKEKFREEMQLIKEKYKDSDADKNDGDSN